MAIQRLNAPLGGRPLGVLARPKPAEAPVAQAAAPEEEVEQAEATEAAPAAPARPVVKAVPVVKAAAPKAAAAKAVTPKTTAAKAAPAEAAPKAPRTKAPVALAPARPRFEANVPAVGARIQQADTYELFFRFMKEKASELGIDASVLSKALTTKLFQLPFDFLFGDENSAPTVEGLAAHGGVLQFYSLVLRPGAIFKRTEIDRVYPNPRQTDKTLVGTHIHTTGRVVTTLRVVTDDGVSTLGNVDEASGSFFAPEK